MFVPGGRHVVAARRAVSFLLVGQTRRCVIKMLVVGAMFAALAASPAFAQFAPGAPNSPLTGYGAVTPFGSPGVPDRARAAAIRACNARASRYSEYVWGDLEFQQYRACMSQLGQME